MPIRENTEWSSLTFAAHTLREIMDNPLPDETAQSRLKQVGMMSVIYYMHVGNISLNLTSLMEQTGLTRRGVGETVDQLVKREMLTEEMGKNSMGRGTARQFAINPRLLDKLAR